MTTNKPVELGKASEETREPGPHVADGNGDPHGDKTL